MAPNTLNFEPTTQKKTTQLFQVNFKVLPCEFYPIDEDERKKNNQHDQSNIDCVWFDDVINDRFYIVRYENDINTARAHLIDD